MSTPTGMHTMHLLILPLCVEYCMATTANWPIRFRIIYVTLFIELVWKSLTLAAVMRGGIDRRIR